MERIKLAVFGVGRWGTHLLRNFLAHPHVQVIAIVDPLEANLQAAAQRFGLDEQMFLTTQWQDALELTGLQAVAIATPAETHYPLITAALKQGLHVLAEKPLTLSVEESVQLCQLAAEQKRQLVIDHTYLFHPAVLQGQGFVRSRQLGALRYGYATRTHLAPVRQDVDALWDLAIHDIAIFNAWLAETPCAVQATGKAWLSPSVTHQSLHFPNGLADTAWATLIYPSGFQAQLHLSWLNPDKQRRLCVVGEQGSLIFDELSTDPLIVQWGEFEQRGNQFHPIHQKRDVLDVPADEPLQRVCEHFLTCVTTNQPSEVSSGWLGAELVQVLAGLSASMQQDGKTIALSPLLPTNPAEG